MEPYWNVKPGTQFIGKWVHYHGHQKVLAPEWTKNCPECGAQRPETDQPITDLRGRKRD